MQCIEMLFLMSNSKLHYIWHLKVSVSLLDYYVPYVSVVLLKVNSFFVFLSIGCHSFDIDVEKINNEYFDLEPDLLEGFCGRLHFTWEKWSNKASLSS